MTERILSPQLLKLVQAAGPGYSQVNPEWVKKFAELIVRECAKVIEDSPWKLGNSYKATDQAWLIKEHFGVEE